MDSVVRQREKVFVRLTRDRQFGPWVYEAYTDAAVLQNRESEWVRLTLEPQRVEEFLSRRAHMAVDPPGPPMISAVREGEKVFVWLARYR